MIIKDISIGTDIEDISRFDKYAKDKNSQFLTRIFSKIEIDYCFAHKNPSPHLAVRFSAKEAVYKALSSLEINEVGYADIEIFNTEKGIPKVRILKDGYKNLDFKLSLSHGNGCSLASVVVIKR